MLERLPLVDVQWKAPRAAAGKAAAGAAAGDDNSDDAETWEVEVELRRRRGGRGAARVHAPRFPKATRPLILGCSPPRTSYAAMRRCYCGCHVAWSSRAVEAAWCVRRSRRRDGGWCWATPTRTSCWL